VGAEVVPRGQDDAICMEVSGGPNWGQLAYRVEPGPYSFRKVVHHLKMVRHWCDEPRCDEPRCVEPRESIV